VRAVGFIAGECYGEALNFNLPWASLLLLSDEHMEIGGLNVEEVIQLPRAEIPLELQKNFAGLRRTPLFYASYSRKLNHKNKVQNRVLIATLDHLYTCHPNGDILRCFPFSMISKIIHDPERRQVGIIVPKEYDLLMALQDTFHFIHVVSTLRALHPSETALVVELVRRSHRTVESGSLRQAASPTKTSGEASETDLSPKNDVPKHSYSSPFSLRSLDNSGWMQKIRSLFFFTPPPGVIVGWNDMFLDCDDDGSGESVVGSPREVCLGKPPYSLQLVKPERFQVTLYNITGGGI
jgi:hypothetical protein